jgi:hypothetical protein
LVYNHEIHTPHQVKESMEERTVSQSKLFVATLWHDNGWQTIALMKVYENMRQKWVMASYGCKYNCIIYGAIFSVFMSKFVQCKYGKNIQHTGMEN